MEVSENLNQSLINLMNVMNNSQNELLKKDEEDNIPENYYIKTLPIDISKEVELSEYEILRLISEHTENLNTEFLKYLKQSIIDWSDNFICSYSYDLLSLLKDENVEKTGEIESKLLKVFSDKGLSYEYKVYKIFPLMFEYLGARANRYLRKVRTEYEKGGITEYLIINIDKILEEIDSNIKKQIQTPPEPDLIDFSEGTDAKTKLAILYELGIFDYLREKAYPINSANKIASLLSAIIGGEAKTLQTYINPIISPDTDQRNAPKKIHKEKARQILQALGYTAKKL
jgi:hypothetical protein